MFLVLLVVLVISMVFLCTCVVKRKRRNGQPSLTGTDTSVQQRYPIGQIGMIVDSDVCVCVCVCVCVVHT